MFTEGQVLQECEREKGERGGRGRVEEGRRGEKNKRTAYKNFWFSSAFKWKRTVTGARSVAEGGDGQLHNNHECGREGE